MLFATRNYFTNCCIIPLTKIKVQTVQVHWSSYSYLLIMWVKHKLSSLVLEILKLNWPFRLLASSDIRHSLGSAEIDSSMSITIILFIMMLTNGGHHTRHASLHRKPNLEDCWLHWPHFLCKWIRKWRILLSVAANIFTIFDEVRRFIEDFNHSVMVLVFCEERWREEGQKVLKASD